MDNPFLKRGVLVPLLISAAAAFFLGLFVGWQLGHIRGWAARETEVQAAHAETADLLLRIRTIYPEVREVSSLFGTITEMHKNSFVIETPAITDLPPLPDEGSQQEARTISVDQDTKISMVVYPAASTNGPPASPQETILSLEDLSIGDKVQVFASENIKDINSFTAIAVTKFEH